MWEESKSFPPGDLAADWAGKGLVSAVRKDSFTVWLQITLIYALIEAALWTGPGTVESLWIALASLGIALSIVAGGFSPKELGIATPRLAGTAWIILGGVVLAATIPLLSIVLGYHAGPAHVLPFRQACQYAVWAVVQQLILQSFFFVRLESILGGRRAVVATALLFGAAHIPSPILTVCSLLGALFFCEMFRRYRNIFSLGLVHAMLGLTIAASFSDAVLRHMRVGEGYLKFHH